MNRILISLLILMLYSCTASPRYNSSTDKKVTNNNTKKSSNTKKSTVNRNKKEYKGISSWYGKDFHGNLTANGEMGKMTAAIKEENIVEYAIEEDIIVNLTISIKFIQIMCGFSKISDVAYLHCSNNRPVKLHYSLDDEDSGDSCNYVRFFVAPKIAE